MCVCVCLRVFACRYANIPTTEGGTEILKLYDIFYLCDALVNKIH